MSIDINAQKKIIQNASDAVNKIDNVLVSLRDLSGSINSKTIDGVDMSVYLSCIDKIYENLNNAKKDLGQRVVNAWNTIKDEQSKN